MERERMTREEAIFTLQEAVDEAFGAGIEIITRDGCEAIEMAIEALEERKTGKWIPATPLPMDADSYKHKRYWKCGVCGGHDFFNPQYSEKIKFCRYCGAELEVDE